MTQGLTSQRCSKTAKSRLLKRQRAESKRATEGQVALPTRRVGGQGGGGVVVWDSNPGIRSSRLHLLAHTLLSHHVAPSLSPLHQRSLLLSDCRFILISIIVDMCLYI